MALSMKAISGLAYIHCLLKRIDVCKQLFVIEVELGEAAFIPAELSQKQLPASMHFYDPVLAIVWDRVSPSTKELIAMRKSVAS